MSLRKVIITGATGRAGAAVLEHALAAELDVVVWGRRESGRRHARLVERTSVNFSDPRAVRDDLRDADAIVWCLGVAQAQATAAQYEEITFGYTMAVAREVAEHRPGLRFVFLSAGGADSTEKSRVRFARTKGRTENALLATLSDVYCARPGYIHAPNASGAGRTLVDRSFGALAPLLTLIAPRILIGTDALATALLAISRDGAETRVLENGALLEIAARARRTT